MSQPQAGKRPRVMVLGGYGLIGSACLHALLDAGFDVTGVGRDAAAIARMTPQAKWLTRDIAAATAADWTPDLEGIDVIVNASGALQDGARDNLQAIHHRTIASLIDAIADRPIRFVQISAAGVSADASTAFFTTKAAGDAALQDSTLDWVILRPTLVLGRAAYGGTALLRAAAATPFVGMSVLPDVRVQTVSLDDLAQAVVQAANGDVPSGTLADLTAPEDQTFGALTETMRAWLGLPPWRFTLALPAPILSLTAKLADAAGWLGWRSPLRSTALTVLQDGIKGDPTQWIAAGGTPCRSLSQTLAAMPATVQDRWFAKLFLLLPLAIVTLSVFWLLSGMIGLARVSAAMETLTSRGISSGFASAAVVGGAFLDIALGAAILWRKHAKNACLGMFALALAYLAGGTVMTPDLWTDPLGPFVKVLPAITLAALTAILLDDR